ncbi:hypothetical protein MKX01_008438 [Papaver californicum]|nr:hypothetical protein MKX01_008438 [Papaver californicum]
MSLKNVAQMLYRRFSSGTTSLKNGGGTETKNTLIRDDKLRSACERLSRLLRKQISSGMNAMLSFISLYFLLLSTLSSSVGGLSSKFTHV